MMNSNVGRPVRFIMAEKSYNQPIIGHLGKLFHSVPVVRPQDVPLMPGVGKLIRADANTIAGEGTTFTTNFTKGDVIMWMKGREKCTAQVQRIHSDTELEVTFPITPEHAISEPTDFKISRRIDHSEMYAQVYDTLKNNHCIGIFPEGGSHDHTSLQPLKAGVALFSLGAAERNISVKVVPCGMTYLFGSKFRSRAYVEFGEPITPPEDLVELFNTDKRKATGLFLDQLNDALRGITINVADYRSLKFLHAFRQLYQPQNCRLSAREYLRLTRRLSLVVESRKDEPELQEFRARVENYSDYCKALLVRDSQAATLKRLGKEAPEIRLLLRRGFTLYMMAVILVPFFVVALPIGGVIHHLASKKKSKALSESRVKIVGADVKSSFNIMVGAYVIPPYLLCITLIIYAFTDRNTALIVLFCLPMAMYISLLIVQEAVMELRAALPLFMSLISQHKQFRRLYEMREELVVLAKRMVGTYDPELEKEMEVFTNESELEDEIEREPSLFSLRYNIRRRIAGQA
ncbi:glycerol-3-phosphate O-acyltransferase [Strigomonas culicis]|nr:glycerol-3-phosphate O-acyltransferase [Strigomonas culicis]|eukprot:EPY36088.1 glycerol-3-phosphate O-acyltransferase [Strigomonas culicis]